MSTPKGNIDELRKQIDRLDSEIVERVNARASLALAIGEHKKAEGKAVFDPAREREVIAKVLGYSHGPFPPKTLEFLYREIMGACRSLEEPTRVAFLGPEATFSHAAALRQFGSAAQFLPQVDVSDVFREVERGNAKYGVVPIENTIEGAVASTLDLFADSDLQIIAEIYLEVSQNLLSKEGDLSQITMVYSHPQPIAQCRNWLKRNLPNAKIGTLSSTAESARMAAQTPGVAAIGSLGAAELYGLQVLARSIEDSPNNVTRFFVIGREPAPRAADPKTSLMISPPRDEAGVLFRVLQPLARAGINMSRIESRPLKRRSWEYRFFVDVDGDPSQEPLAGALAEMRQAVPEVRVLGTFAKSPRPNLALR